MLQKARKRRVHPQPKPLPKDFHQQMTVQILRNTRRTVDERLPLARTVADSHKNAARIGRVPPRIVTG
jgi:hypothetical protein